MKKIVLFALGMAMSMTTFAQDEVETTISADVVSSYIWRGQDLGLFCWRLQHRHHRLLVQQS